VVKPTAALKWPAIFRGGSVIDIPGTTHIGFVEYPDVWRDAFDKVLSDLKW